MKLILNSLFILFYLISGSAISKEVYNTYKIKVKGIGIGKLEWNLLTTKGRYKNDLKIYSEGFLSTVYKFKGKYYSEGVIENQIIKAKKYSHFWQTKKTTKKMNLIFKDNKIISLEQFPVEKEKLRFDIFNVEGTNDPLSSFLQILIGGKKAVVVDGRRTYTMEVVNSEGVEEITIKLNNYLNLWADHKRSKFEKIIFIKKNNVSLPFQIHIYFDGRVFKLIKI